MVQTPQFQIEPISLPKRPTAFAVSLALHAIAGLLLFATAKVSSVPFGVNKRGSPTYIEFAHVAPVAPVPIAAPKAQPALAKAGDVVVKSKSVEPVAAPTSETPASAPTETQFGNENGTVAQGDLGEATGFKATNLERYLYELRVILANRKIYPATSKRLGETGRVVVKFNIRRTGAIENLALQKPSDYSRLNEAAMKLVATVEKYKPFPEGESIESLAVEVPIDYVLN